MRPQKKRKRKSRGCSSVATRERSVSEVERESGGLLEALSQLSKVRINEKGAVAQLGERLNGIQEVGGSIPPSSRDYKKASPLDEQAGLQI